jgi:hypothetical protein
MVERQVAARRCAWTHYGPAERSENEKSSSPGPLLRGPSEVFRIVKKTSLHETLPRNRFLLHRRRFAAPMGSNTETDDDCRPATFHRGVSGAERPSRLQNNRQVCGISPSETVILLEIKVKIFLFSLSPTTARCGASSFSISCRRKQEPLPVRLPQCALKHLPPFGTLRLENTMSGP